MDSKNLREKWSKDFARWFDWIIDEAEVYDYGRYPVKGMGIWMPYGFQIRRRILEIIRDELDSKNHEEVLFPLLIPKDLLKRESEHIKGFEDEVYWVTHGGLEPLDIKLALRPTSETSITYMETYWIKSYRDLPKKYYQIVSMFRYETKATRPMIRLREVTTFKEAHTVHDTFDDVEHQVLEAIEIYKKIFDSLNVPYVISKRPEWDKFPGALYTIAFDTIMPDGRALQIGTVHNLGQNFTKAFNFKIQLRDQSLDFPWQTSYGISDRIVATLIAIHGDDRGLSLPPRIAPVQIAIVPIPSAKDTDKIKEYINEIVELLKKLNIRHKIDNREEMRPGAKFYYWEAKGVPLRFEIGIKEVNSKKVLVLRRDLLEKIEIDFSELSKKLSELLKDIERELGKRAWSYFNSRILRTSNLEKAKKWIENKKGIVELPWNGKDECALKTIEYLDARALGTPYPTALLNKAPNNIKDPICEDRAITWMRYAKTY